MACRQDRLASVKGNFYTLKVMAKEEGLELSLEGVKERLLSLDSHVLSQAEGIGLFGSLVRGDFHSRSDIDVFIVVSDQEGKKGLELDHIWYERIMKVLAPFQRDVTVLIYDFKCLREICNWYVLRLASDGVIIYDKEGKVNELFKKILKAAREAGLVKMIIGDVKVWAKKLPWKIGERFEVKVID